MTMRIAPRLELPHCATKDEFLRWLDQVDGEQIDAIFEGGRPLGIAERRLIDEVVDETRADLASDLAITAD